MRYQHGALHQVISYEEATVGTGHSASPASTRLSNSTSVSSGRITSCPRVYIGKTAPAGQLQWPRKRPHPACPCPGRPEGEPLASVLPTGCSAGYGSSPGPQLQARLSARLCTAARGALSSRTPVQRLPGPFRHGKWQRAEKSDSLSPTRCSAFRCGPAELRLTPTATGPFPASWPLGGASPSPVGRLFQPPGHQQRLARTLPCRVWNSAPPCFFWKRLGSW